MIQQSLVFFIILFSVSSCSVSSNNIGEPKDDYVQIGPSKVRFDESLEQIPPIEVDVSQAFFNQDKLNVKVDLKTLKDFNSDEILVGILGLKQGDVVEQNFKRLKDIVSIKTLDADSNIAVRFELQSNELTEYQISCSWGLKAKQQWAKVNQLNTNLNSKIAPTINVNRNLRVDNTNVQNLNDQKQLGSLVEPQINSRTLAPTPNISGLPSANRGARTLTGNLELQELDILRTEQRCSKPPCNLNYTVTGSFFNGTSKFVSSANLAIGLYWVNEGQLPNLPTEGSLLNPNEQLVAVQLDLDSSQSKEFSIKLDKEIPQVPGGGFVPHVRFINSNIIKESIRR